MIIDQKGKLFGKISIVDILIIVIIIAAASGVYYKFHQSGATGIMTKTDKVEVSFFMEDAPDYAVNAVKEGDLVKDRQQNVVIGKVTSVTPGPDIVFYADSEGIVHSTSKPGYASIAITVEAQATYSDTGFTINGSEYYINKQFETRVGLSNFYMRISDIKKLGE
jgi:hypothetical protein